MQRLNYIYVSYGKIALYEHSNRDIFGALQKFALYDSLLYVSDTKATFDVALQKAHQLIGTSRSRQQLLPTYSYDIV